MSSSTSVAAWAWPTWVVSRRRVLEAAFVLLESPSLSRRIFIGSHSLPLSGSPYRSFTSKGRPEHHTAATVHNILDLLQMLYLISSSNSSSNSNEDSSNIVNKVIVTMAVIVLVTAMLIAMKAPNCCAFTVEYQELQCSTVTPIYCNPEINRKKANSPIHCVSHFGHHNSTSNTLSARSPLS
jgi:hypothetical protein